MRQKLEIEQAKAEQLKIARAAIRLKHAIAADRELNERLPEIAAEFDRIVSQGELPDGAPFEEVLDGP